MSRANFLGPVFLFLIFSVSAFAGDPGVYRVLTGISHGSLTVFPVVSKTQSDSTAFLTLDEGLKSGQVVVAEAGSITPLMRRRKHPAPQTGAEVNRLLLVNNSDRPLLLLAGEIVKGGKQDRVVGKDRIVPPDSDPVDLSVFCVEPGRWQARAGASNFDTFAYAMAAPSVRNQAMAKKDQQGVWDKVRANNETIEVQAQGLSVARGSSSNAMVISDPKAQEKLTEVTAPIDMGYRKLLNQLKGENAVGVVVAVKGKLIWADVFASTDLLQRYWQKLVQSYAAEALGESGGGKAIAVDDAQAFLNGLSGKHESVETEPDAFRYSETSGAGFKVFALESLLPKMQYRVHLSKMVD